MKNLLLFIAVIFFIGCGEDPIQPNVITIEGTYFEEVQSGMNFTDKPATWLVVTEDSIFREETNGDRLFGAAYELGPDDMEVTMVGLKNIQGLTIPCPEDELGYTLFPNLRFNMELSWNPKTGELQGQTWYETDEPLMPSDCTEDPHESVAWDSIFRKQF